MIEDPGYDPMVDFRECVAKVGLVRGFQVKLSGSEMKRFFCVKYQRVDVDLVVGLWERLGWVRIINTNISPIYCLVTNLGYEVLNDF